MSTVDELVVEVINAKDQLKAINATINRDREVAKELENDIVSKKKELADIEKELVVKNDEIAGITVSKDKIEK